MEESNPAIEFNRRSAVGNYTGAYRVFQEHEGLVTEGLVTQLRVEEIVRAYSGFLLTSREQADHFHQAVKERNVRGELVEGGKVELVEASTLLETMRRVYDMVNPPRE